MALLIRRLQRKDFKQLLEISLPLFGQYNDGDFPYSESYLNTALTKFLSDRECYFKGMFEGEVMVGWFLGVPGHDHPHSNIKGISQLYYHTSLKNTKAVRALIVFHQDFFNFAEQRGFQIVITSSSLATASTFTRVLERSGWRRKGACRLTRVTKFHPSQTRERHGVPPGTRVLGSRPAPEAG